MRRRENEDRRIRYCTVVGNNDVKRAQGGGNEGGSDEEGEGWDGVGKGEEV